MPRAPRSDRDTSIGTYKARRDFTATPEPAPEAKRQQSADPIFVVQKHAARRLHWDFRLEHGGVLWSWAVPKGPSLDPADKRLAVRTEDHPLDYADFAGTIPEGHYGAGTVETWDRGTWAPQTAVEPAEDIDRGELKFLLRGTRLNGRFVLIRLKPRPKDRAENWLLIKEHDAHEQRGTDVSVMEETTPLPKPRVGRARAAKREEGDPSRVTDRPKTRDRRPDEAPAPGAIRGSMPDKQAPELASAIEEPPTGADWLSEVKFDGYRLLAFKNGDAVRLLTRNGLDWTARLPTVARDIGRLAAEAAVLDGELVALREDGVSSFALLQQALSDGVDRHLMFYAFDLLHLDGWDLRPAALVDRKRVLSGLSGWTGALRYSDHVAGEAAAMRRQACGMGLEGIICKQANAPYRAGRGRDWVKLKCQGREEFIVLGFTPPAGARVGLGSLHLGYRDPEGALQYIGGVGTGFTDAELDALRRRLDPLTAAPAPRLVYSGEPPDTAIVWVKPELVAEVQFTGWSGSGRIRHATYLGLREDKPAGDVVRPMADPEAPRVDYTVRRRSGIVRASSPKKPASRKQSPAVEARPVLAAATVVARRSERSADVIDGVKLTHGDRELWPGVTKRDLAEYWQAVASYALPEIGRRPLALVRCPEGIAGERFFQKHGKPGFPGQIRAGEADGAPYLVIEDLSGLIACAQVSAIELHAWGSIEPDALHPDRLIFDLDPGDNVGFATVVRAAHDVRERLKSAGLESFCRTTGGKGLHVVAPVRPQADWTMTRAWCREFAEAMAADKPDAYVSRLAKAERTGKILVDWLRNGLGSTAVASLSPRARPGATVATPLAWNEVGAKLDPLAFTIATVPERLAKRKTDPWRGFADLEQTVPAVATNEAAKPKRKR